MKTDQRIASAVNHPLDLPSRVDTLRQFRSPSLGIRAYVSRTCGSARTRLDVRKVLQNWRLAIHRGLSAALPPLRKRTDPEPRRGGCARGARPKRADAKRLVSPLPRARSQHHSPPMPSLDQTLRPIPTHVSNHVRLWRPAARGVRPVVEARRSSARSPAICRGPVGRCLQDPQGT